MDAATDAATEDRIPRAWKPSALFTVTESFRREALVGGYRYVLMKYPERAALALERSAIKIQKCFRVFDAQNLSSCDSAWPCACRLFGGATSASEHITTLAQHLGRNTIAVKWKKEKYYYGEVGKRRNTIKETWEKEKHYCGELETELWAIRYTHEVRISGKD